VLQSVWTTVGPGWQVLGARSSDPEYRTNNETIIGGYEPNGNMMSRGTDLIVFSNPAGSGQVTLLMYRWKEPRTTTQLDGLTTTRTQILVTSAERDLDPLPERTVEGNRLGGGPLLLPPTSVMLMIVF